MDYKKLYEQSLKERVADEKLIAQLKKEKKDLMVKLLTHGDDDDWEKMWEDKASECNELKEENEKLKKENEIEKGKVVAAVEAIDFMCPQIDAFIEENKILKEEIKDIQRFDYRKIRFIGGKEDIKELKKENEKLKDEIKELKEEVIVERKKVIEEQENRELAVNCWTAEARFLNMDSAANQEPEEFNEFLKEEYDEEMYKKMYDEFDLKELLACVAEEDDEEGVLMSRDYVDGKPSGDWKIVGS
jgi:hypothetical protein